MKAEFYPFTMLVQGRLSGDFFWPDEHPIPDLIQTEHNGPFAMTSKISGLTCTVRTKDIGISYPIKTAVTVWGYRKLENPTAQGYEMIGRVKIKGKRYRAFTSDMLVTISGKLHSIGCLYVSDKG